MLLLFVLATYMANKDKYNALPQKCVEIESLSRWSRHSNCVRDLAAEVIKRRQLHDKVKTPRSPLQLVPIRDGSLHLHISPHFLKR